MYKHVNLVLNFCAKNTEELIFEKECHQHQSRGLRVLFKILVCQEQTK